MKTGIHPQVFDDAKVTCTSCKAIFVIPGTEKKMHIEICSNCHPVYTGKYRGLASSGQVDKFKKKMAAAKRTTTEKKPKKRKLTSEEKLRQKLEEVKVEKGEQKRMRDQKEHERKVRAAKKTIKKPAASTKKTTGKAPLSRGFKGKKKKA